MPSRIAVLIDGENVRSNILDPLVQVLQTPPYSAYRQDILRVYGDWSQGDLGPWRAPAEAAGYELVQVTRVLQGKSCVDQGITIDAIEILASGRIDAVALVTRDTDFIPLLTRLRSRGMEAILIGDRRSPPSLRARAHTFVELSVPGDEPAPVATAEPWRDLLPSLLEAYVATERNGNANMAALGAALKKVRPDFEPKKFGSRGLRQIVERFPETFQVLQDAKDPKVHYVTRRGKDR